MSTDRSDATPLCHLLELAPELRNRIYEHVLMKQSHQELVLFKDQLPPALLLTCSQIRREAGSLYYASNTFLVTDSEHLCIPWLKSILPDMRTHIRKLRLYTHCRETGLEAASYKEMLLRDLRLAMDAEGMPETIVLEVFVTRVSPSGSSEVVWTSDPLGALGQKRFYVIKAIVDGSSRPQISIS